MPNTGKAKQRSGGNTIDSVARGALQREVGARIAGARGTESQEKFASRAGISRQRLSAFETGLALPDALTFTRLAPALGKSVDYLLLGKEPTSQSAADIESVEDLVDLTALATLVRSQAEWLVELLGVLRAHEIDVDSIPPPPGA